MKTFHEQITNLEADVVTAPPCCILHPTSDVISHNFDLEPEDYLVDSFGWPAAVSIMDDRRRARLSNVPDRILEAMTKPTIGHLHPEFCKVMDDCKAGVQYAFQTNNKMTLVLSSTGHAGMECVMTNLLEKDNMVLIANHGIWGERAMDMARRQVSLSLLIHILI